jgi:DeoR/GlpR family transcriptional regulator of sugar metabolism
MAEINVKVYRKRERSARLSVQRRRQRLIGLWHTVRRFTSPKAAGSLGVTVRTIERDLAFLKSHELLSCRRHRAFPFELIESGAEFMQRFQAAHQGKVS